MAMEAMQPPEKTSSLETLLNLPLRGENPYITQWKNAGGRIFGYICSYVPEEVLYAHEGPGKILPIRMGAQGCQTTEDADIHMNKIMCSFARCLLQLGLTGEYDFLDGLVVTNCCEHMRRIYEQWRDHTKTPVLSMISVPHEVGGANRLSWYSEEIQNMTSDIGKKFGYRATEASLRSAAQIYDRYRALMLALYALRAAEFPLLTGSEAMKIAQAGFSMPKEVFNDMLEEALEELRARPGIHDARARLMVCGSYLDDTFLMDVIESTGAIVVTDSLCSMRKYIEGSIGEAADPMAAIIKRYFSKISCPRMVNSYSNRLDFTRKLVRDAKVDGVIFERMSFCDNHAVENLMESKVLEKEGIPTLHLEREYMAGDTGRYKTRVQAFLEKIGK
ncbi:MAG: 2-hydroxyacyl-CoA dehydratase family protein [Desulfobacterales bacterium]|nr:2-hydroxyacyl-CoA dehydratase family protein [Desulfobacterales bacterium]